MSPKRSNEETAMRVICDELREARMEVDELRLELGGRDCWQQHQFSRALRAIDSALDVALEVRKRGKS